MARGAREGAGLAVVEVERLGKRFGRRWALADLSVGFGEGKFYALLGQNGAGKSTLMKIIMRSLAPSRGRCRVLGRDLALDSGRIALDVGYVSEELGYRLPVDLGGFARLNKRFFPAWDDAVLRDNLTALAIDPAARLTTLSRGQKMRFFLAVALARRPKLLLLDEVGSVLDAHARAVVSQTLTAFVRDGGTVLMATNIPAEVQHAADELVLLDKGRLHVSISRDDFARGFVKLRRVGGDAHPAFEDARAVLVATNVDASESYLMPRDVAAIPEAAIDRRAISVEEMCVYYLKRLGGGAS
jgi:ABC-2 type transport system ATP-binding protein